MRLLVGIDDTDAPEGYGTGHRARDLGARLAQRGLGRVDGITRHQLLVSPEIPYTSHNSSACLVVCAPESSCRPAGARDRAQVTNAAAWTAAVVDEVRAYLITESAVGSDAGLCVANADQVGPPAIAFGRRAKVEVLTGDDAHGLAARLGYALEGVTGTRLGVIGALAAVGLRAGGDDGRFLWRAGLRDILGVHTPASLAATAGIDEVATLEGESVPAGALIDVGEWVRPVLRGGKAVLLAERVGGHHEHEWQAVGKDVVKRLSN